MSSGAEDTWLYVPPLRSSLGYLGAAMKSPEWNRNPAEEGKQGFPFSGGFRDEEEQTGPSKEGFRILNSMLSPFGAYLPLHQTLCQDARVPGVCVERSVPLCPVHTAASWNLSKQNHS